MNVFTFDIETVPDVASGRRLYDVPDLDDDDVARIMFHQRRQKTGGSEFLPLYLHRVVAISVCLRSGETFRVWSLGEPEADEPELIRRFFDGIERFVPDIVSWNGGGFDLPVLHYRALLHGVAAPRYWETGDEDSAFRYNNYLNRFHSRHTDLMDVLSGYQGRAVAPLEEIAVLLGLPGKMGMHGSHVWEHFREGQIGAIRDYCETDVLNTYLVYLRFQRMRGRLSREGYAAECAVLREGLEKDGRRHLLEFLDHWIAAGGAGEG
ncbi:MAG TPA: 3'-5' exonuclease [Gammaproteobacteria bacterium]|nr:3'-5' exonuclease [Gammaproteobacteria bacterium]